MQRSQVLAGSARRSGDAVGARWLARAAAWVAEVAPDWEALTGARPLARSWVPLLETPDLQGWLICWPTGQTLDLHDHGGAAGAYQLLGGTLTETFATQPGARVRRRRLHPGRPISFGPRYIHAVSNRDVDLVTSVHFYGRADRDVVDYVVDDSGRMRPAADLVAAVADPADLAAVAA